VVLTSVSTLFRRRFRPRAIACAPRRRRQSLGPPAHVARGRDDVAVRERVLNCLLVGAGFLRLGCAAGASDGSSLTTAFPKDRGYSAAWYGSADPRVREDRRGKLAFFVVIWIMKRSIRDGAIVRVPAAKALTLADTGHQLAGVHRGPVVGNSAARGRGAGARATVRR
jgi:hypothetical protein